ncbi:sugar ABC transporter substrate-binding protein [Pseudonocardia sp. CA-107938]|uniref:sugar ABC transporter substrate-binding protein n=1 Tax=Pseudonocardia sp. CA-107938 TaxID=3240021 RepID=UPI003D8E5F89
MGSGRRLGVLMLIGLVLSVAACGGGSANNAGTAAAKVDTAKVDEILRPYTGTSTAFPVDQPLTKKPQGATIAYLQCATPFCAIFSDLLKAAADAIGARLTVTKADASATGLQSAADTIISQKPDAVILPGIDPATIKNQLAALEKSGTPVLGNGIIGAADYGIDVSFNDTSTMTIVGTVLAAWALKQRGAGTNAVFYTIPELNFSGVVQKAFSKTYADLCPDCALRTENIPVSSIGSTAPQKVVSDLQAHPGTNIAVFASEEAATGLPAQLKVAGLHEQVKVNGFGAPPAILEDIKSGRTAASMDVDVAVCQWALVDAAARLITGQPLTDGEKAGIPPLSLIDAKSLDGKDVSRGYAAYPDFVQTFTKLWSGSPAA